MTPFEAALGMVVAAAWAGCALRFAPPSRVDPQEWSRRSARMPIHWAVFAVAAFLTLSVTVATFVKEAMRDADEVQKLRAAFLGNLASGVAILGALLAALRFGNVPSEVVFGRRVSPRTMLLESLLAYATWLPLAILVHAVARHLWPQPPDGANPVERALRDTSAWDVQALAAAVAVVRAPVLEELAFRGFLLTALARYGVWPACLISAYLFAAVHSAWPDPIPLVIVGAMFGSTYIRTGSLVAPIFAHALYNGTMTAIALLPKS